MTVSDGLVNLSRSGVNLTLDLWSRTGTSDTNRSPGEADPMSTGPKERQKIPRPVPRQYTGCHVVVVGNSESSLWFEENCGVLI